jgi:hypothetical protein
MRVAVYVIEAKQRKLQVSTLDAHPIHHSTPLLQIFPQSVLQACIESLRDLGAAVTCVDLQVISTTKHNPKYSLDIFRYIIACNTAYLRASLWKK